MVNKIFSLIPFSRPIHERGGGNRRRNSGEEGGKEGRKSYSMIYHFFIPLFPQQKESCNRGEGGKR